MEVLSEAEQRFERGRKTLGLFLGPAAGLGLWLLPLPLDPAQHQLAAILAAVVVYWITEAVPLPVTALLGPVLCVVAGIAPAKEVLAPFANPVIFLLMGGFFIAQAMVAQGLDRRLALGILSVPWLNASPARLLIAFGAVTCFLSMWISNSAATAMMFPIGLGLLAALGRGLDNSRAADLSAYSTALMLMAAYGSSVGGLGTLIGTPPNLIGVGFIAQASGQRITFLEWMAFGVPIMALLFLALALQLHFQGGRKLGAGPSGRASPDALRSLRAHIGREKAALGPATAGQKNVVLAFLLALSLWLVPGVAALAWGTASPRYLWLDRHLPENVVSLLAAGLLFVLPTSWRERRFTLEWKDASRIDWGTLFLFGGGLALGELMFKTGLSGRLGQALVEAFSVHSLWGLTGLAIGLSIVVSELTSNTAAANMLIPVMLAMAATLGVDPVPPALGASLGSSFGFMLPISTAPNAIVYGSGLVPIPRMVRAGLLFDFAGFLLIWAGLRVLLPLLRG